ncbi:MAG TPA: APC family permease [Candidatus Acidoferrum sp.]|jgi:amino acid transporter|nr:APC family permease [Candidatus Acidoferrum sp.]
MNILDLVVGKPLATSDERAEQIGPGRGIPIFGLDALSSAAYGTEAALSLLIPAGLIGLHYILPISTAIIILLVIVYFSYRQTIAAYPNGGGSYTVARFNLGPLPGLLAAAALLTDYILTAAVGISAGVGALVSAVPSLQPHIVSLCLAILVIITILNLRGLREAGFAFMFPTYLFVGTLGITIAVGLFRVLASGGHPAPLAALPPLPVATQAVTLWLLLKAFSSGCAALTGIEAVSNGVKAFRDPGVKNAQRTLTIVILILAVLLAGISYLAKSYGITAMDPGKAGYQSLLSLLIAAVFGRGFFYYLTIASILLVLSISANTAFADFPRLCRSISLDNYLPHVFAFRGRRLVYAYGIIILALLAAAILVLFGGITDRLIPLYAIGAFIAFTLSQFGMVVHWRKKRGPHWVKSAFVNGLGGFVTGVAVLIILVAKFVEGAWITILFIPMLILVFSAVRRHYHSVSTITRCTVPMVPACHSAKPIAVVPVDHYSQVTRHGLELASRLTTDVIAVHVEPDEHSEVLYKEWDRLVVKPFECAGDPPPKLVRLPSPYRFVIVPIVQYILQLAAEQPERRIVVVIPELAEGKWYEYFLHNQRGRLLEWLLLVKGNERIFTLNAPYYLGHHSPDHRSATTTPEAEAAINTMVEQSKSTKPSTS